MDTKVNILVPLDVILDTRMGTLSMIAPELANQLLSGDQYHDRRSDFHPGLDKAEFDEAYRNRDEETLKHSICTNILPFLRDLVTKLGEIAIVQPMHTGAAVFLNEYPYSLDDETKREIITAVQAWLGEVCPIDFVNHSPEALTPLMIRNNYQKLFMYDYGDWLELQTKHFEKTRISEVELYVPAIIFTTDPTDEEIRAYINESMHPLEALRLGCSLFIGLTPISVGFFSIIIPKSIPTV